MSTFTVRKGRRYRATLSLSWLEQLASNEEVARPIRDAGFVDVKLEGKGGTRRATARWPRKDATADIPPQITKISEIET